MQFLRSAMQKSIEIFIFIHAVHEIDVVELAVTYVFILPFQMLCNTAKNAV